MRLLPVIIVALWANLSELARAAEPPPWPQVERADVDRFARARAADAQELLLGPRPPRAPAAQTRSCDELYARRVALVQGQLDYSPRGFFDEPRNQAGALIGAMWTPAFYYLPFRALQTFTTEERARDAALELDQLRAQAAQQRCYER
jgi:hypothetical protein